MPAVSTVSREEIARSRDTSHFIIEFTQVTKVLKRLGIAFADYICVFVTVENIDNIPGISIWSAVVKNRLIVEVNKITYHIPVLHELSVIREIAILVNDSLSPSGSI